MPKAIIHVNKQFIAMNKKDGGNRPVFTCKIGNGPAIYSHGANIKTNSKNRVRLVQNNDGLKCGAVAYIECDADDIIFENEMSFEEGKNYGKE